MTSDEFNDKWGDYLEDMFYGMGISHEKVIEYLDSEFTKEIKTNTSFNYAQIKMKFGSSRVYANSEKATKWENKINELIKENG